MAISGDTVMAPLSTTSHDTALCIIPPVSECGHIDNLREVYDKAYGVWPPHINLIYPFVAPENLTRAQFQIQEHLKQDLKLDQHTTVELSQAGLFKQRKNSTVFLCEARDVPKSFLQTLRQIALQGLGQPSSPANLHLTIGQSESETVSSRAFLLAKAKLIPTLRFRVGALAILIRERATGSDAAPSMRLWGTVDLAAPGNEWKPHTPEFWSARSLSMSHAIEVDEEDCVELHGDANSNSVQVYQTGSTYAFDANSDNWMVSTESEAENMATNEVTIASYNVLIDSEYPPDRDRDPLILRNLLSDAAVADVLVLQEISDDFLSYLLGDNEIRRRYPFTSHGPPDQPDIGPLPSMRNIVILSRWPFRWTSVPFHRRHKGALVAQFKSVSASDAVDFVVAGVHLSCGLTDGSVAAKHNQLKRLSYYLSQNHASSSWILAGDFNIATSACTIDSALKTKSITEQTAVRLSLLEQGLNEVGLLDAWSMYRLEANSDASISEAEALYDGEAGATFDPKGNMLAADSSNTSDNRPQRYDRIFIRSQEVLRVDRFNIFGLPETVDGVQLVASDHYSVRATMRMVNASKTGGDSYVETMHRMRVEHKSSTTALSDLSHLQSSLYSQGMIPTEEQTKARQQAFEILKDVILGTVDEHNLAFSGPALMMVAVGSYALGVWTVDSDLDCLCVGPISSKTFFKLARQRLIKAQERGIRLLRKVEAKTGTMLELSVHGIAVDLQYCPAGRIAEKWSEFHDLPASDPIFNLSVLSLRKLKPYRDFLYIQRTVPSLSAFRVAYRCIKLWAVQRGIYASKFGYLSGTHITLMLTWICKRLAYDSGSVSAADIIVSFFNYYANFNWTNELLFDAFFHKSPPRYHRSAREPMVILGYHTPNSNVAHTSTIPGLQILVKELKAAIEVLSRPETTWDQFLGCSSSSTESSQRLLSQGTAKFLATQHSFVKIDIQYWGRTLAKGKSLVGWIESRCLSLVVDINKMLPELEVRIWPARFTDNEVDTVELKDYHGCYLVGLTKSIAGLFGDKEGGQLARQSLETVLDRFLTQLRTDERNYDPSTSWVDVSLSRPSEIKSLRLDDREWGDYTADMDPDSDDEEDLDDGEDVDEKPVERTLPQRPKPTATPVSTSKLRPASDVLNRLRWDPSLDPSDYIIGYEDRFLGAKETNLDKWKTEQTDEEFIPQHRILYFKKKGGDGRGELVWERMTRLDKVFGSGAGPMHRRNNL
ncbi:hypothetical protein T440DRAFT_448913 [Plenodomus tracheiphilus IPT5]|uniref:polynucleotide adenylyltransferase n=1 Tax=Plenodomus tracheiphilus IPT5 TaxID=1408161 RepID=A0A6A7B6B7_9PLEO|nr:hypothetical protein T440DRAFT_448913 [Plenodomus tracheiphilus IPT5]